MKRVLRAVFGWTWRWVVAPEVAKLIELALPIVIELAASSATGGQKRVEAARRLRGALKAYKISASTRAINLAIELALSRLPKA